MGNLIARALIMLSLFSCGNKIPYHKKPPTEKFQVNYDVTLTGTLSLIDNKSLDLSQLTSKPYILMISGETCQTCLKESSSLVELFLKNGGMPKNVDIYTLVLGGYIEDAQSWAMAIGIPWEYGIDPNQDQIFKKYCTGLTPCVLAVNPSLNKYTRFIGESSFEDWQKETLKWEY